MLEFDLLKRIFDANHRLPPSVVIPPGDDMGGLMVGGRLLLATVDQVAGGVHFDPEKTPVELIGRKAMTRNLSDVAAMAARPLGAVAAATLPRDFPPEQARRLCDAMRRAAEEFGCPLIGGDLGVWDHPLIISVTLFAEPDGIGPILRSTAKPGDEIYVTGRLGGAWQLLHDQRPDELPHLNFEPRIELARRLAGLPDVKITSMIDLSDGLAGDLRHICRLSGVMALIDPEAIPCRPRVAEIARLSGRPAWQHAMADGEDYELCFTVRAAKEELVATSSGGWASLPGAIDGVPITRIGRILSRAEVLVRLATRESGQTDGTIDAAAGEPTAWPGSPLLLIPDPAASSGDRIIPLELTGWEHRTVDG